MSGAVDHEEVELLVAAQAVAVCRCLPEVVKAHNTVRSTAVRDSGDSHNR
jgi:hypothetical protein